MKEKYYFKMKLIGVLFIFLISLSLILVTILQFSTDLDLEEMDIPTNFTISVIPGGQQLNLTWIKNDVAKNTYIEYSFESTWSRGSGINIYNDIGSYFVHKKLDCNTTYYYQAWSWRDNSYSNSYIGTNATTGSLLYKLNNSFVSKTYQYMIQLHMHSNESDGDLSPFELETLAKNLGYIGGAITDHDMVTDDPNVSNFTHLPGVESWAPMGDMGFLGVSTHFLGTTQERVNMVLNQNGLAFVNHPTWIDSYWTDTELLTLSNYTGIEIFNSGGGAPAENKVDHVLTNGRRILIIATSDFHNVLQGDLSNGFIVINTDINQTSLTWYDIISIIRQGNYFSAGRNENDYPFPPHISNITVDEMDITITLNKISQKIEFIADGEIVQTNRNTLVSTYRAGMDETYIRIKVTEAGSQFLPMIGSFAWSNPIYVEYTN